ncbi:MAG: carboxypeptidase-like regulatory domain-containing protein, partial [Xanthobacteraceae bacterium]
MTTTVFTDESGDYYFPPLPAGKYRVWSQALTFKTAKTELDLPGTRKQAFVLEPLKDYVRQLPGNIMLAALPEDTDHDKRMKRIVRTVCTGCHTASYILQHKFDEAGWTAVIELMKNANVYGAFMGGERKPSGILDYHQKELAAYLARARGPGESTMKFKLDSRPVGEAARVMFKEYDVPLDPDAGLPENFVQNDGSDWSLGTPSVLIPGWGVHDAWLDLDGQLWFTCNIPNRRTTIGKIDPASGAVKLLKVPALNGLAAQTHGMTRDEKG